MSRNTIPSTITREQMAAAVTAFWDTLGVNALACYPPLVVTHDAIHVSVAPVTETNQDDPRPAGPQPASIGVGVPQHGPQSDLGELAFPLVIRVADD